MTDKPIIFSAPMVQALLAGRKSQTRRILNPQPNMLNGGRPMNDGRGSYSIDGGWKRIPYAPGDRLYVREAHAFGPLDPPPPIYRATAEQDGWEVGPNARWRPSIHMPRWASRLTLTVTEVRVQRLQEISEADAVAEGIERARSGRFYDPTMSHGAAAHLSGMHHRATAAYSVLWNSLHGPDAWDANPWVVAISFTVQHGNIDGL